MKKFALFTALCALACVAASAQRLPEGAAPTHYAITFNINFAQDNFQGDETIDVNLSKPSNSITVNAVEIDFHDVTVACAGQTQTAKVTTDEKMEMATFTVAKQLPAGPCKVHINYTGHLNDKLRGLYLSTYHGRKYAVSQMEATDARVAFPGFDEPAYKATFDISAIVDKGDTAISNGQIVSDTPGPGDKHTIKFSTSPKMSSYLVALTAGDWKCESDSVDGIALRVCTVPGKENLTRFPLDATKAIMSYYDKYYGVKYPLPKLDQIAVPDFQAGAMENWGAIVYRETALLIDEKTSSVGARQGVTETIAHEVAHQWFGDLVTMKWWDDIWLNEGFATWMTPHPIEAWKPEWLVPQGVVDEVNGALATDAVKNTRPIHQEANSRNEIDALFDGIAYGKTAAVLHMLESYLGHETFRAGVNSYLKQHAYGNATAADFWNAMTQSSKKPVDKIMPTFVMQAGEPYVEVDAKCEGGNTTLAMSQKRYLNTPAGFNEPNDQLWQIPVCAKGVNENAATEQQCFLLTQRQQSFTMKGCSKFVFPDAGALGYYRYNYDSAALQSLGAAAEKGLTPEERISLVGNEWALMRVGKHTIGQYLAMGDQFKNTKGSVLIADFLQRLDQINDDLVTDQDRPAFQAWLRHSFSPMMQQLGYTTRPGDSPEDRQKRADLFTALGNVGEDPQVIAQSQTMVQEYMKDPTSIDGTMARAVIAVAARHGNEQLYEQFKAQLKNNESPEVYYRYLYSLADFPQQSLIQQTLNTVLSPEVRGQDLYILIGMLGNPASQDLTWRFMQQNFDPLMKKTGGGLGGVALFFYGAQQFCDAQKKTEVEQFFKDHPFPGTERNQREALERIDSCIELKDQQQTKLAAWLKDNGAATTAAGAGGGANISNASAH